MTISKPSTGATGWNTATDAAIDAINTLGTAATANVGAAAGTVAAGDDTRITGSAQKSSNLSDLANTATARNNLGLAAIASSGSASDLVAGTAPTARLGSGTASNTTFLRGDNTWAVPATSSGVYNVRDYGATGNGSTDDTAAINAAMSAARVPGGKRGGIVRIPAGVYQISAPINLYDNVHVIGDSSYFSPSFYNASILRATVGFTGSAMMLQNPDGNTVSDPTPRPDESWHFGLIEHVCFYGNGTSGPHGLDPGWNGEATTIRNCSFTNCNSGIYLNNTQASGTIEHCSMFENAYGLNCDGVQGVVRVFGISGDNNTSLIRVKGGRSANVTVMGMKAENYISGTGDPVIDIVDLAGGAFTLIGGWADTATSRSRVIRVSQPGGSTQRARVTIIGFDHNSLYTNLLQDTYDGNVIPAGYGAGYPAIFYNVNTGVLGTGDFGIGYARSITGQRAAAAGSMYLCSSGSDDSTYYYAGPGSAGGRITDAAGVNMSIQWRVNGQNNIGFLGATPVTRQTVTGSRGGNAALASLLTALANLGLITDSSS